MNSFEIFGSQEIIQKKIPISFTFGNFDGVHLGHQFFISSMRELSKNPVVVLTFEPHPANLFKPNTPTKCLMTTNDKIKILLESGVDAVIVQKFTSEFSFVTAHDFCAKFLAKNFNIDHIFLGYDLSYGKDRQGDFSHMTKFAEKIGWNVIQLQPLKDVFGDIISSSRIRSALTNAKPVLAENLLGRPYFITGTVFCGDGRGRQLGFPTANINFDESVILPYRGVYACEVELPKKYPGKRFLGVMNCGVRPTISSSETKIQIEAHILNFNEDIYGEEILFHLKHFIRPEQKFDTVYKLQEQIKKDLNIAHQKLSQ